MKIRRHSSPRDVRDLVSFRMAAFTTINDRIGQIVISNRFGMTLREWRTLATIAYLQPALTTTVAHESFLDKAQTSRIIAKLVDDGLVERIGSRGVASSRGGALKLSAKGEKLYPEVLAFAREMNELLLEPLADREIENLLSTLDRLVARANERYLEVQGAIESIALADSNRAHARQKQRSRKAAGR